MKLRHLRTERGLSQEAVARALGLAPQSQVSVLEQSKKLPSFGLVTRVAQYFGISLDYLLRDLISTDSVATFLIDAHK